RREREEAGRSPPGHARPGQQVFDQRAAGLAGLALAEYLAGLVSPVRLLRHSFPGPHAEHRPVGAESQRTETGGPLAARAGETAPGGQVTMSAKANILAKLRTSLAGTQPLPDDFDEALVTEPWSYPADQRVDRLRQLMEAVHTETHLTTTAAWPALLELLLTEKRLPSLLIAPGTPWGEQIATHFAGRSDAPQLKAYD